MIIADETDEAADGEVGALQGRHRSSRRWPIATRRPQDDPSTDIYAQPNRRRILGIDKLPTNQGVLVGSYASVARMLDELAAVPGVRGVMMTFDDFVIGMEQFGTRIMPLMRCRERDQARRMSGAALHVDPARLGCAASAERRDAAAASGCRPGWSPGSRWDRWRWC